MQSVIKLPSANERFFNLLGHSPNLTRFFNREKRCLDIQALENVLPGMNSADAAMAKFFASVWLGNSEIFHFDVVEAMKVVNRQEAEIIKAWVQNPFFP